MFKEGLEMIKKSFMDEFNELRKELSVVKNELSGVSGGMTDVVEAINYLLTLRRCQQPLALSLAGQRGNAKQCIQEEETKEGDPVMLPHIGGARQWKLVSILVAFPAIGLGMFNAFAGGAHHERPEFIPYEHLRIRTKRFPWGDGQKTLFHNPHLNALPDG
ncbi:hypothetical protein Pmani_021163 [Petrolisthes manimaculis]|uniref:Cytochrome c oxidase subunit n=1 Tax=Petrolisthes manimaculis TaxID=1843537 RepID=A0AAE1PGU7_9EUCA|nr:hypothetical protein Pmani_021163 [Petrolisthes manimaculis]